MSIKKSQRTEFVLDEHERFVRAALCLDDALVLDFEAKNAQPARIRSKKPNVERLLMLAEGWSSDHSWEGGADSWLDFYIRSRHKEVAAEILNIRKAIKRIEGASHCIEVARAAKERLKSSL